jgi:phosphatidylserine/phosphatidylglycerophosphate/cardiolipin synthase-like enzyme
VLLQTPYLVLSDSAQAMFRAMHRRQPPPRVVVSTSSLASTDSFITYALSYKYKRRYLRDFGFEVHEYKPFPIDSPVEVPAPQAAAQTAAPPAGVAAGAPPGGVEHGTPPAGAEPAAAQHGDARLHRDGSVASGYRNPLQSEYTALAARQRNLERVPLSHPGVRTGLHAKSMVVDGRIAVIGTHNFDPRGDHYNTESAVVIPDAAFARELGDSIRRDIAPANSWTIAPRDKAPVFSGLEYSLAKMSERMPIFDLWPVRYATSYEFVPGPACPQPLSLADPAFHDCYRAVGDFPEVNLGFKSVLTRIFTAFGAGLAPVL